MAGTKTYDPATLSTNQVHKLALVLGDTATIAGQYLWFDEELQAFLDLNGSDLYLAAADACRAAATSHAKIAVAISVLGSDVNVDRTAVAREFRMMSEIFATRSTEEPFSTSSQWTDGDDTWAGFLTNRFSHDFEDAEAGTE